MTAFMPSATSLALASKHSAGSKSPLLTGERLPVVVDLPTLNVGESNSLSFVLRHKLDQPLGMIEGITKTQSDGTGDIVRRLFRLCGQIREFS